MPSDAFDPSGHVVRKMHCIPYTELLQSERAEVPDTIAAILELVDNPIEELLKNPKDFTKEKPLHIQVFAHEPKIEYRAPFWRGYPERDPAIVIEDNAGGVAGDNFERLFRFGERGDLAENGISAYGRGGKRARLKLGNKHIVISRHGEKQYSGFMVVKTGDNTEWDVDLKETTDPSKFIPKGSTRVGITDLLFPITPDWLSDLRERLGLTYSEILDAKNVKISLNEIDIVPKSIEHSIQWSGGADIEPGRIGFDYKVPVLDEAKKSGQTKQDLLQVKGVVTIGLQRKTTTTPEWGFDIICNGRLLQQFVKRPDIGFCEEENGGWGVIANQKISMVRGVIHLYGPSKAMPWRANKVEFDEEKLAPLRERIVKCCAYWVDAGKKISRLKTEKISGTLNISFDKDVLKLHIITKPPEPGYNPPTKISLLDIHRIAFKTTVKMVELAKQAFKISEDEVNQKAKEIFEDAVQTETSLYTGKLAPESIELKDLGLQPALLVKLGKAGIQIPRLKTICKMKKKEAISELRTNVEGLSEKEAEKIYQVVQEVKA